MILKTMIVIFALTVAIGGFGLWLWIDAIVLPKRPNYYLRYSAIGGALFCTACSASFVALVVLQSGQRLMGIGILLGLLWGVIVGIGMASPYWIAKKAKGHSDVTGDNSHV